MKSKSAIIILIVLVVAFLGYLFLKNSGNSKIKDDKIQVTASFYPLAEFASQVGKDKVTVSNLTPAGSEPHDFDPTPRDIVLINQSKVFIYNGVGLEAWVEKVLPDLQKSSTAIVKASGGINFLPGAPEEEGEEVVLYDPHVWVDPVLASKEVENIKEGLKNADPANSDYYEGNAKDYENKLSDLDIEFQKGLAKCQSRSVVVSHNAFTYIAKRYNLNLLSISGLSPDEEPSPQKLAEVVDFAKKNNVKYIFFETLVSPKLSETIAREVGAKTLVLNPVEGLTKDQIAKGKSYLSVQRENLANLKFALGCE